MSRMLDAFRAHLERFWPDSPHEEIASARPRVEQLLPGFRVRRIAPDGGGRPWVYATVGASLAALEAGEDGAEYVVLAPYEEPVLAEMLAALATINAQPGQRLGVGSTIALGRPWMEDSAADHLLVLPPYPVGDGFQTCELDGDRRIVVLWLVPVTAAEAAFARAQGCEALEQLIADGEVNVADPARVSVV